jgi:hypothetical protein
VRAEPTILVQSDTTVTIPVCRGLSVSISSRPSGPMLMLTIASLESSVDG